MPTWVTHLMIADKVIQIIPTLDRHEFMVGNIAPDCNVESADWTSFTPSRQVTHWMTDKAKKTLLDCDRFLREYIENRDISDSKEESFLLGYYLHLITDAEFQRFTRDPERIKQVWVRIKKHPILSDMSVGMEETWESAKKLVHKEDRMKDINLIEKEYLDKNPTSGYLTDIMCLTDFPDYIDYLPKGAIPRKIRVMGYMPQKEEGRYPNICMTAEEYNCFVDSTAKLVVDAIYGYLQKNK